MIASGPDYYGFTHATIAKMIQDLPGADKCKNYIWQEFGEMHQRTAAGVAAAAQKKLTNLEIMGSANKRAPSQIQQQQHQEEPAPASRDQMQYHSSPSSSSPIPTGTAPVPALIPPHAGNAYENIHMEQPPPPPPPEPFVSNNPYDPIMVKRDSVDHHALVPIPLQHPPLPHPHPPHPHAHHPHPHQPQQPSHI